ncbi:hypothetical protein [Haladaptatus salinisoli]|uniref:hypothetical protein n=1 Tax=Haladaptatus salinisoli TaxID=2884876 RepID=UPI001D0A96B1|nr:hypothetical protein [Haladaptatus salinisoli]
MSRRSESAERDGGRESIPIRTIDDATYGKPPTSGIGRRLTRTKRWVQIDANRWFVTGLLLSLCFLVIVLVGSFGPVSVQSFLTRGIAPGAVLVELLKAIVSVVVIVLSINQLVLSPGLGPVGEQQDRYEQTMELREKIEEHTGVRTSPTSPARFLHVLMESIVHQAERLREVTADSGNRPLREETSTFADSVIDEATSVAALLSNGRFGRFEATSAALRFAISGKVRTLRDIRKRHEQTLSASEAEAFDEMDELLELFAVSREYLKTVYIRSEYIGLSEGLLYTGLPSIVLTYCAAQIYAPTVFPGQLFGIEHQLLFVSGAVTVALAPIVLLIAYVFRLAVMSRSTLFIGPFAARSASDRETE